MVLASASAATFYGAYLAVLGSVLVLFSFLTTGMTEEWSRKLGASGAICLAGATVFGLHSDLGTYSSKHPEQAALAILALIGLAVFIVWRVFAAQSVSDEETNRGHDKSTQVTASEPPRQCGQHVSDQIGEKQNGESGGDLQVAEGAVEHPSDEAASAADSGAASPSARDSR